MYIISTNIVSTITTAITVQCSEIIKIMLLSYWRANFYLS